MAAASRLPLAILAGSWNMNLRVIHHEGPFLTWLKYRSGFRRHLPITPIMESELSLMGPSRLLQAAK